MPQVGVKSLRAGGAEEDRPEDKEPSRVVDQNLHGIPRVEGFEYRRLKPDVAYSEDSEHQEPQQHEWAEAPSYGRCAKPLRGEYQCDYKQGHRNDRRVGHDGRQPLN